jgi:hypothetical protein
MLPVHIEKLGEIIRRVDLEVPCEFHVFEVIFKFKHFLITEMGITVCIFTTKERPFEIIIFTAMPSK